MNGTLEERMSDLEQQVAELARKMSEQNARKKDWRKTVGMLPLDEVSLEADRLGREWREQQKEP